MPDQARAGLMQELYDAIVSTTGPEVRMTRSTAMWAHDEIVRLRQGLWDVYAALGFDTDGDRTPAALAHPDIVTLVLAAANEARADYDEVVK